MGSGLAQILTGGPLYCHSGPGINAWMLFMAIRFDIPIKLNFLAVYIDPRDNTLLSTILRKKK